MLTQAEKGLAFHALHGRTEAFIIPNPWDPGTARLLEGLRFEALATTSAGHAFSRGLRDRMVGRDAMLAHVADIHASTSSASFGRTAFSAPKRNSAAVITETYRPQNSLAGVTSTKGVSRLDHRAMAPTRGCWQHRGQRNA